VRRAASRNIASSSEEPSVLLWPGASRLAEREIERINPLKRVALALLAKRSAFEDGAATVAATIRPTRAASASADARSSEDVERAIEERDNGPGLGLSGALGALRRGFAESLGAVGGVEEREVHNGVERKERGAGHAVAGDASLLTKANRGVERQHCFCRAFDKASCTSGVEHRGLGRSR